jgi:UDP-N-acetylmuramoylalanine--D-glutamate ligase
MELKGKKVLIFGLARSGAGAANLLSSLGADVTVTDRKPGEQLGGYAALLSPSVKTLLGSHPAGFNGTDLIVVSPGVPLTIEPLAKARSAGIKIIGELELAYRILKERGGLQARAADFLAVTGTNGKSTTTSLLDRMLRSSGFETLLGGNIGNALTEEIMKTVGSRRSPVDRQGNETVGGHAYEENLMTMDDRLATVDFVVVEVSSFQLESVDTFRPRGATILNITPDHLDRYHSLAEYAEAKANIFLNQGEGDFLVLNGDDPALRTAERERLEAKSTRPEVFYFSRQREVRGAYMKDGLIRFHLPDIPPSFVLDPSTFAIKGVHNLENAMAASAMALLAGCGTEAVADALREFPGLEHRMEFVRELGGVHYINDSKGTNVGAVLKSLEGIEEPVVLIAGGRDKAGDFAQLRALVKERVKTLVLIGEASEKIRQALGDVTETVTAPDLKEAVDVARERARPGEVVLLSPACASFDMFRDFEDRGAQFKKIVRELR